MSRYATTPCAVVHVGDALEGLRGMATGSVDAVVTDPPYGMSFQSARSIGGPRFERIDGDEKPMVEFIPDAVRVLRPGGALFVFCEWRHQDVFRVAIEASGATMRNQCIWDRESHGMGDPNGSFAPCHDVAWFATKGGGFSFYGPRPQTVLRFSRVPAKDLVHPAEKPIKLLRHVISRICPPGGLVLDPFGGSGTTAVAAIIEGRSAVLFEKVGAYADIAKRRIDAATTGADWRRPSQGGLFTAEATS